ATGRPARHRPGGTPRRRPRRPAPPRRDQPANLLRRDLPRAHDERGEALELQEGGVDRHPWTPRISPRDRSAARILSTLSPTVSTSVCTRTSGLGGASYGSDPPLKR